jgi:hypothetical protein
MGYRLGPCLGDKKHISLRDTLEDKQVDPFVNVRIGGLVIDKLF